MQVWVLVPMECGAYGLSRITKLSQEMTSELALRDFHEQYLRVLRLLDDVRMSHLVG